MCVVLVCVVEMEKIMPDQTFVLVAEDEDLVRFVIVQALLDEGFGVIEAEHAEAALIVLESRAGHIHVLFTDIQMPGTMDGLALAHHTSKHWPWIGLLVTSARPHPDRAAFPEESRFLAKPYDRVRLSSVDGGRAVSGRSRTKHSPPRSLVVAR
jgi:CheY-like chemotaxis protein